MQPYIIVNIINRKKLKTKNLGQLSSTSCTKIKQMTWAKAENNMSMMNNVKVLGIELNKYVSSNLSFSFIT